MGLGEETGMNSTVAARPGLSIAEYESSSAHTDRLADDALTPVRLGLFGEVGGLMATSKKYHREGEAYVAHREAVIDEFGDTLWYLTALCRRLGYSLEELVAEASQGDDVTSEVVTGTLPNAPIIACVRTFGGQTALDDLLVCLGQEAASLLHAGSDTGTEREKLVAFTQTYLRAVQACKISLTVIATRNLAKIRGRFLDYDVSKLPDFDARFPEEERLPQSFRIEIKQRGTGKCYLRWNGVFIGDPLTDNIEDSDDYRFHDVFHFAHAAILHWSPTFRALIRQKRKSEKGLDENQDGGRAIVIEEGLTAYIFACAKELNFFEGQASISFDLLKTIENFVRGYEVEQCPLKLWEEAIMQGYAAFRLLREHGGGVVVGNRKNRTIAYELGG